MLNNIKWLIFYDFFQGTLQFIGNQDLTLAKSCIASSIDPDGCQKVLKALSEAFTAAVRDLHVEVKDTSSQLKDSNEKCDMLTKIRDKHINTVQMLNNKLGEFASKELSSNYCTVVENRP